jgi:1-acyl-sn-glycerol-3-phosphate acyltransferase
LGWITAVLGTVYLDRSDRRDIPRILAAVERALSEGRGVIFFPEGTSSSGAGVEPFRSPFLALPARGGHPVHAAALSYRTDPGDPPAHLAVCWWGDMEFIPHLLSLMRLRRVEATLDFCPEPFRAEDRKLLAEQLRAAIAARFQPVVPAAPEAAGRLAPLSDAYGASE